MPKGSPAVAGSDRSKDLKHRISPLVIAELGEEMRLAWPAFPSDEFVGRATAGLAGLEMKGRVVQVADALAETLPDEFPDAAAVIGRALDQTEATEGVPRLDGWIAYPVDDFVARYGIDHPRVALPLIARLTPRWTCEYAIRPFIEVHPEITFEYFDQWIDSDDEHLRRLVSEGSRPRLPWGAQLKGFIADPAPTIALLDRLVDDPSLYVRRSVANHLNDITKDHPELAIAIAGRWLAAGGEVEWRAWIVNHGMRSLIKRGDPAALALAGYDQSAEVEITGFKVSPESIAIGEAVTIEFRLTAPAATPVMVDYAVHHAGTNGARAPKVFKLKKLTLQPGVEQVFRKSHRIREVSVRRIHPGPHRIEVQVNGRVLAAATVSVLAP